MTAPETQQTESAPTPRHEQMPTPAEIEATARLFAAAPDMLTVLREVADYFADTDAPLGERIRAALTKAGAL